MSEYLLRSLQNDPIAFIASVLCILSVAAGAAAVVIRQLRRAARHYKTLFEDERKKVEDLGVKLEQASEKIESLRSRLPEGVAKAFVREQRADNYKKATALLEAWLLEDGQHLSRLFCGLSDATLARAVGDLRASALVVAEAYAGAAIVSEPSQKGAHASLREIGILRHTELQSEPPLREALERVMSSDVEFLDPAELQTAIDVSRQARLDYEAGHYRTALSLSDRAIALNTKLLGRSAVQTCAALNIRSFVLMLLGHTGEALSSVEEALRRLEDNPSIGPAHIDILATRCNRATVLRNADRPHQSLAEIREVSVVAVAAPEFGPDAEITLLAHFELAATLERFGSLTEALSIVEDVYQRRALNPGFGVNHHDTLTSQHLRARIMLGLGRTQAAISILRESLPRWSRFGAGHLDTLNTQFLLAAALERAEADGEALNVMEEVLRTVAESPDLGVNHPMYSKSRIAHGRLLSKCGRELDGFNEVKEVADRMVLDDEFGPNHFETLIARQTLAVVLNRNFRTAEALEVIEDTIARMETNQSMGISHPETRRSREILGEIESAVRSSSAKS